MTRRPSLGGPRPGWHRFWKPASPQAFPIKPSLMSIFAFPNRSGVLWGVICVIVLLWSLNNTNNAAILLGCLLAAAWFYAGLMPAGRLMGVRVVSVQAETVSEGGICQLKVRLQSRRSPDGLLVEFADSFAPVIFSGNEGLAILSVPCEKRGVFAWPVLRLTTRRPFGVSSSWVRFWPEGTIVVWPRSEISNVACPGFGGSRQRGQVSRRNTKGQDAEEWSHLREYRPGDRWRDVDWKRLARTGGYWVREFDQPPGGRVEVRWVDTEGLPLEGRLRRLAKWLLDAESAGRESTLVLPNMSIGPSSGQQHRAACLTALAGVSHE